ncbi:MAG: SCO family protein [Candidatus Rokubacteria bacterium]|nr:SCO family protein [Candidatus Rokubacteria bacterium]
MKVGGRLLVALVVLVGSLGVAAPGRAEERAPKLHGIASQSPTRAPDFELTSQSGQRQRLSALRGKLVLLYFGYTHCPGICPTTLTEIAQALGELGPQKARRVQVVMVSVDPERDAPPRLTAFLTHFHPSFLGMTGTPQEIAAVAARYGVYVRKTDATDGSGYAIDHTSIVIAVDAEGFTRLVFPYGTQARAMAEDLAQLLSAPGAAASSVRTVAAGGRPGVTVEDSWTPVLPPLVESSELYMTIQNAGSEPDRLVAVRSAACEMLHLYEYHRDASGALGMRPVAAGVIDVPAGGRVELKPGGLHLMCMGRKPATRPGATLPVTLTFDRAGDVATRVTVRKK